MSTKRANSALALLAILAVSCTPEEAAPYLELDELVATLPDLECRYITSCEGEGWAGYFEEPDPYADCMDYYRRLESWVEDWGYCHSYAAMSMCVVELELLMPYSGEGDGSLCELPSAVPPSPCYLLVWEPPCDAQNF